MKEPKVTLVSWTPNPIGVLNAVWEGSKTGANLEDIMARAQIVTPEARALFKKVIEMEIPVAEFINFVYIFEDVPIFWREQLVRQRKASYWSQSHRIFDLSDFGPAEMFNLPPSIAERPEAERIYRETMNVLGGSYNALVKAGVPMEDARSVIPMSATHRIAMQIELRQLIYVIKERSCHILQGSIWRPIIDQMISQLVEKVDPIFSLLKTPICYRGGKFTGCRYVHDNERRYDGADKLPPCVLWMEQEAKLDRQPAYDSVEYAKQAKVFKEYFNL